MAHALHRKSSVTSGSGSMASRWLPAGTAPAWQNRFLSCTLGPSHLLSALAYVDLNPRARLFGAVE